MAFGIFRGWQKSGSQEKNSRSGATGAASQEKLAIPDQKTEAAPVAVPEFTPDDFTALFGESYAEGDSISLPLFFHKVEEQKNNESVRELRDRILKNVKQVSETYQGGRLKVYQLPPDPTGTRQTHEVSVSSGEIGEWLWQIGRDLYALTKKVGMDQTQERDIAGGLQVTLNTTTQEREFIDEKDLEAPPKRMRHRVTVPWPGTAFKYGGTMKYEDEHAEREARKGGGYIKEVLGWMVDVKNGDNETIHRPARVR